jgi:hypothetical protein
MDSRRLMLDTLEMANHNRAPRELWLLPWAAKRYPEALDEISARFPRT